jgi:hypothetical protein
MEEQQSSLSLLPEALSLFTKPYTHFKHAKMLIDEPPINIVNVTCHGCQEETNVKR